jgi:hypothetical protein
LLYRSVEGGLLAVNSVAIWMPFSSCAGEAFRYVTMVFFRRPKIYGVYFILLDHICLGEDDGLSVSQRFGRYPASNLGYRLSYANFLTLSNPQRFGRDPALTHDLSYSCFLTPLSNAQCVTLYYDSTIENQYLFCISYLPCLLVEQQRTVEDICVCTSNMKLILSVPVGMHWHPSRIMDIILSSFWHGYDCLYLSRNVSHICIALNLRFQQTLHTKHDFRALKKRLIGKFASFKLHGTPLVTFFCNCAMHFVSVMKSLRRKEDALRPHH